MSRRDQIRMSDAEVEAFMAQQRTVTCATLGPRGWPHLMPLWYVLRAAPSGQAGPRVWAWTYGSSQKVRNLERDARATLQIEAGETYDQLRGVVIECEVLVHRQLELVRAVGQEVFCRYAVAPGQPAAVTLPAEVETMLDKQATKRVALEFAELRRASWDHRKLAGVY